MINLIYVSKATEKMSNDELVLLLRQSRDRNKEQNITGILIYADGIFFQVLEGENKDVEEVYQAIERDVRNKDHIVLVEEEVAKRNYPHWSMGFRSISPTSLMAIYGFSEIINPKISPNEFSAQRDKVLDLLYGFKEESDREAVS